MHTTRSRNLTARNTTVAIWSSMKHARVTTAAEAADAAVTAAAAAEIAAAADVAATEAAVEIAAEAADAAAIVGKLKSNHAFESGKFELIDFPLFYVLN